MDLEIKKLKRAEVLLEAKKIFNSDFVKSKGVVNIQAYQGTRYDLYVKVEDAVKESYKSIRMDLAKKYLKKYKWEDLTTEEKTMLKLVVREPISEQPVTK